MREILDLIKREPRARLFFVALGQSALGTGAALVALLVLALERFDSPWAIGLVLLADVIPGMVSGRVFGAVADRWSRRTCVIARGPRPSRCFRGPGAGRTISFSPSVSPYLQGWERRCFNRPASPRSRASSRQRGSQRRPRSTACSWTSALSPGPAIAAVFMLAGGPEAVLVANAVTFAVSALLLASIRFGEVHARDETEGRPIPPSSVIFAMASLRRLGSRG